jgi:hypothetical protein
VMHEFVFQSIYLTMQKVDLFLFLAMKITIIGNQS